MTKLAAPKGRILVSLRDKTSTMRPDAAVLLDGFDGQSKLLLRALMSGPSGTRRGLTAFQRLRRANSGMSLGNFVETLCRDRISCLEDGTESIEIKPLVCLFPTTFKQNLLSFLYLVQPSLPESTILPLLKCLVQETGSSPWVTALVKQLEGRSKTHHEQPMCTNRCAQRLKELSKRLVGSGEVTGWAKCFSSPTTSSELKDMPEISEPGSQRKRKGSFIHLDSDSEETGQHSKRRKTEDECADEGETVKTTVVPESVPAVIPLSENTREALPEDIKVSFLQIKELLQSQDDVWDQNATDLFKVLNDCDPRQVEVLCTMLKFPELPEHILPKLCNSILSLSPDLSYSTATSLIKHLLLEKILALSEPASRCMVMAATSLCNRYPRSMCHALIGPVLDDKNIGSPQVELLNRLIGGCLESHYKLLVLQLTFKVEWSEAMLSVIHSLLDSEPFLNAEVFTQFTEQLVTQSPLFTKSMKFAKMMLTALTKYGNLVNAAHKNSLSTCLMSNETFLKKPLQAALKRITPT
ncbi:Fanconi anemia group E protein [Oryzias melastigma]|uniref:FA complementation group E n=1 Tax=Oryzias melastigma TaxID=30732 RepID=A0A3B3CKI6_ORYME|nr:Fanconi anemia group E protein [Oryzias melastigma]